MNHTITLAQLLWALLAIGNVGGMLYVGRIVTSLGWTVAARIGGIVLWPLTLLLVWIVSKIGVVQ